MGAALELPAELPDPDFYAREVNRYPAPEGTRFAWRLESSGDDFGGEWSTDAKLLEGKRCRWGASRGRAACGAEPVAALNRSNVARRSRWWTYCAEHLYGRVFAGGQVYALVLEEVPADG